MNRFLFVALGLVLATPLGALARQDASPPAAAAQVVPVPPGTRIVLALDERLDSRLARTGQRFVLSVSEDVVVQGAVMVPKGATAQGTVLFARKKGAGRSGALDLRVDHVDTPAGRVRVRASQSRRSEYIAAEHAVVSALFGLGAVAMQGENIVLEPGARVEAEVVAADAPAPVATPAPTTDPQENAQ